jgi:hypothetical protein
MENRERVMLGAFLVFFWYYPGHRRILFSKKIKKVAFIFLTSFLENNIHLELARRILEKN